MNIGLVLSPPWSVDDYLALRNLVQRKILQSESSVKNMPSRTDFNAAATTVFGRAHLHVASRTDQRRIVTFGGQLIAALKPELQLQVGVVGDMCSSAGMSSKEGSSFVSAKGPGRSWRPLATSRPLLAGTPPGPLKAEAGVSCRRLPAYFVLISTAYQFRSDTLPDATRYQFMSETAPI
jgi:hypothetical protein